MAIVYGQLLWIKTLYEDNNSKLLSSKQRKKQKRKEFDILLGMPTVDATIVDNDDDIADDNRKPLACQLFSP